MKVLTLLLVMTLCMGSTLIAADVPTTEQKQMEQFSGTWSVTFPDGKRVTFSLLPDGTAVKQPSSVVGTWTASKNQAWVNWQDGWRDNIRLKDEPIVRAFKPGSATTDRPVAKGRATRTSDLKTDKPAK